ncbi:recQ-mediated genome instability protein 1 isoform X2 [Genypterus blacodes]|uniref:recQ-mediated genome instability protein 1 isoform X2 n=1 Tax=Genypterus blacodes TaxID=154954 RepID=UPI003F76E86B
MAPEIQALVPTTQAWLKHSWHVQVPFAWLEACVNWLLEDAGGAGHLSQQQINQQVLDQWLLTDLRDLDHPVLPDGISQAQKTELSGTFCVQVDSLLDISQPAYGQLQRWRGTDCGNDGVSAVTQETQKPWEIKTTRMLLLQVTDGVQSLEAMEYQPIAALSTALRPGTKLLLQGKMVCRLGVLLLGPANVKILGGEVEDLAERNNQGRLLCRTLGLPEEQQQEEEAPPSPHQVVDEELDDQELLASLEAQEEADRFQVWPGQESGYGTMASGSSTVRSHVSTLSTRSSFRSSSVQSSRASVDQPEDSDLSSNFQEITDHHMADEEFPDEDFDDLPLDELDVVLAADSTNVTAQFDRSHRSTLQANRVTANPNSYGSATKPQTGQCDRAAQQQIQSGSGSQLGSGNKLSCAGAATRRLAAVTSKPDSSPAPLPNHDNDHFLTDNEGDFMDEDMDRFIGEVESYKQQTGPEIACSSDHAKGLTSRHLQCNSANRALTLTSPPFIYLCLLQESKPHSHTMEIRVKAFIVTLLGKLSSNNGVWRVCATISDGTGYMDVELSDQVLTGLLGFSVAEKEALKRDPARRSEFEAGKKRCQEELVDMCCVMTIKVEPEGRGAVVTKAEPVSDKVLQELEHRVRGGTK